MFVLIVGSIMLVTIHYRQENGNETDRKNRLKIRTYRREFVSRYPFKCNSRSSRWECIESNFQKSKSAFIITSKWTGDLSIVVWRLWNVQMRPPDGYGYLNIHIRERCEDYLGYSSRTLEFPYARFDRTRFRMYSLLIEERIFRWARWNECSFFSFRSS